MATFTRTFLAEVTQTYTLNESHLSEIDCDVITAWMNNDNYNDGPVTTGDIDEIITQYADDNEEICAIDDWQLTISATGKL